MSCSSIVHWQLHLILQRKGRVQGDGRRDSNWCVRHHWYKMWGVHYLRLSVSPFFQSWLLTCRTVIAYFLAWPSNNSCCLLVIALWIWFPLSLVGSYSLEQIKIATVGLLTVEVNLGSLWRGTNVKRSESTLLQAVPCHELWKNQIFVEILAFNMHQ